MVGTHLQGGVVGGWAPEGKATATGIIQKREHPKMRTFPPTRRCRRTSGPSWTLPASLPIARSEAAHGNPRVIRDDLARGIHGSRCGNGPPSVIRIHHG